MSHRSLPSCLLIRFLLVRSALCQGRMGIPSLRHHLPATLLLSQHLLAARPLCWHQQQQRMESQTQSKLARSRSLPCRQRFATGILEEHVLENGIGVQTCNEALGSCRTVDFSCGLCASFRLAVLSKENDQDGARPMAANCDALPQTIDHAGGEMSAGSTAASQV